MPKRILAITSLLLTSALFTACSDDDKESARVKAAEVAISHNSSECPKVSGVYKNKDGVTQGVLAIAITDDGNRLQFASETMGVDGHTFILDGKDHEERENGKVLKYTAGCDNQALRLVGSLDNGNEKIDMTITESEGGSVRIKNGEAEGSYEKVIGQKP